MRFANLQDWLAWQEKLHPSEIELGLDRVATVLRRMELGEPSLGVVSVAGTNGKGSCVAMLDAIYRAAGYSVGTYTSPHIKNYNERISINGITVSDQELCEVFEEIDQCRDEISLTYFEFGTLAAISLMYRADVDIAILEVGLGGRLDAVNILDADVAVISSIGLDHQDWLGDDREKISIEKAGIARAGRPVVCGDMDPPESLATFLQEIDAPLYLINRDFYFQKSRVEASVKSWDWKDEHRRRGSLPMPALRGDIQLQNAATVLKVIELLMSQWPVSQANIREGLSSAVIPARFQVIPGDVTLIFDVAHNPQAAQALAEALNTFPCRGSTIAVFGCFKDKDLSGILDAMMPVVDRWFVASLGVARERDPGEMEAMIHQRDANRPVTVCDSINVAKESAIHEAMSGDRVVVFGSFLAAAEVL